MTSWCDHKPSPKIYFRFRDFAIPDVGSSDSFNSRTPKRLTGSQLLPWILLMWRPTITWSPNILAPRGFAYRWFAVQRHPSLIAKITMTPHHDQRFWASRDLTVLILSRLRESRVHNSRLRVTMFSTPRISKRQNSSARSTNLIDPNPMATIPLELMSAERHSTLTLPLICRIQQLMKLQLFSLWEFQPSVLTSQGLLPKYLGIFSSWTWLLGGESRTSSFLRFLKFSILPKINFTATTLDF